MDMKKEYKRVACSFYDELEILAMRRENVEIFFTQENGEDHLIHTKISNLNTKNKEEFLLTDSGHIIRLDKIKTIKKK